MSYLTPEDKVKNAITDYVEYLQTQNYPVRWFRREGAGRNYKKGLPDLYLIWGPFHIEVEVKAPGGTLSSMQELWGARFKSMGTPWWVIDDIEDFKIKIKDYFDK